jgi:hypothetical protein
VNVGESTDFQALASYLRDRPNIDTPEGARRLGYAAQAAHRLQTRAYKQMGAGEVAEVTTWRVRLGTLPRT